MCKEVTLRIHRKDTKLQYNRPMCKEVSSGKRAIKFETILAKTKISLSCKATIQIIAKLKLF